MKTTLLKNILTFSAFAFSVGTLNAQISTWTGSADTAFENAANWSLGTIPNGDTRAYLPSGSNVVYDIALFDLDPANTNSYITHLNLEKDATITVSKKLFIYSRNTTPLLGESVIDGNYTGGNIILNTGADMNFRRGFYLGTNTDTGTITINDGTFNNNFVLAIAQNGNGTLNMNGGTISNQSQNIVVGGYNGYGTVNLNGGTMKPVPTLSLDDRADRPGAGHITIDGGTIELTNDLLATATAWIIDGKLKAAAGKKINIEIIDAVGEDPFADPPVAAAPAKTIITAVPAAAREIAYLTKTKTMGAGASMVNDDAIIRMLQADPNFNVTVVVDPASSIDLSGYDLVIAQETFDPSDAIWTGSLGIKNINVPTIINNTRAWASGSSTITDADATVLESTELAITVADAVRRADPLFSGIDFSAGNNIQIFNALSNDDGTNGGTKGLQILNNIDIKQGTTNAIGGSSGTLHASITADVITPTAAVVFNELRKGTQIGENALDVLQAPVIAFSMNYGAIANGNGSNLTSEALTIWRNAAYHLTGMISPNTLYINPSLGVSKYDTASNVTTNVKAVGNKIYVSNVKSTSEINIYSITGALVKSFKTTEDTSFNLRAGLWIATVKTFEGQKSVKLLTK